MYKVEKSETEVERLETILKIQKGAPERRRPRGRTNHDGRIRFDII